LQRSAGFDLNLENQLAESVLAIRRQTSLVPRLGVILGSGLSSLSKSIEGPLAIPYASIPHMPNLTAAGHVGELIFGSFSGVPTVMMRGRAHLYEGHLPSKASYGVRLMHALGCRTLVASNAAGGLNPRFSVGQLVAIDGHINLMNRSGLGVSDDDQQSLALGNVRRRQCVYDRELLEMAELSAHRLGFGLSRGIYLATLGPTYETRAEYRAFRQMGADMVGMSTVPETVLAATLGMKTLAFSVITNVAAPDALSETSHDEVLIAAELAQGKLTSILQRIAQLC
jgi:purine-nucleoside phosphorylase